MYWSTCMPTMRLLGCLVYGYSSTWLMWDTKWTLGCSFTSLVSGNFNQIWSFVTSIMLIKCHAYFNYINDFMKFEELSVFNCRGYIYIKKDKIIEWCYCCSCSETFCLLNVMSKMSAVPHLLMMITFCFSFRMSWVAANRTQKGRRRMRKETESHHLPQPPTSTSLRPWGKASQSTLLFSADQSVTDHVSWHFQGQQRRLKSYSLVQSNPLRCLFLSFFYLNFFGSFWSLIGQSSWQPGETLVHWSVPDWYVSKMKLICDNSLVPCLPHCHISTLSPKAEPCRLKIPCLSLSGCWQYVLVSVPLIHYGSFTQCRDKCRLPGGYVTRYSHVTFQSGMLAALVENSAFLSRKGIRCYLMAVNVLCIRKYPHL